MNVLEIANLSKRYRSLKAVDDLSFQVEKGKVYGILGPNGSGKSTTLGMLLGVINPSSGSFGWFGGKMLFNEALKKIGAIIERPNFYPYMNGQQNLELVCKIKGIAKNVVDEKLALVGLLERKKDTFKTYSMGMKQRLAIASALLSNPVVLVLDEPTNGLDPEGILEIREIISKIAANGTTVLLASHLLDEVEKICTNVVILRKGKKLYSGSVEQINLLQGRFEIKIISSEKDFITFLENYQGVSKVEQVKDMYLVYLNEKITSAQMSKDIFNAGFITEYFAYKKPSLEQQFITLTKS